MACLWLKEPITLVETFCMFGAFGGILLMGLSNEGEESESEAIEVNLYIIGLLCGIGSTVT